MRYFLEDVRIKCESVQRNAKSEKVKTHILFAEEVSQLGLKLHPEQIAERAIADEELVIGAMQLEGFKREVLLQLWVLLLDVHWKNKLIELSWNFVMLKLIYHFLRDIDKSRIVDLDEITA